MAFPSGNIDADHCKEKQYSLQYGNLREANSHYLEETVPAQSSDESEEEMITDFKTGKSWIIRLIILNYLQENSN